MTAQQPPRSSGSHRAARPSGRRAALLEIVPPAPAGAAAEAAASGSRAAGGPAPIEPLRGAPAEGIPGAEIPAAGLVLEGAGRRVVLVGSDDRLVEEITAVCAAADAQLSRAHDPSPAQLEAAGAASAQLLLLAARDLRSAGSRPGPFGIPAVLLGTAEDADLWELAARIGGDCTVAVLPEAEPWLADRLADLRGESARPAAGVLGVMGAVGGAGASTLSCWLAAAAAPQREAALVDGDPHGCGIDLLLGTELEPALRWPDLVGSHGALSSRRLWEVLPEIDGLTGMRWLSWDRRSQEEAPVAAVLRTLRRACDLVVLDLGRVGERSFGAARLCDAVLVVVPRTARALLCARRIADALSGVPVEFVLAGPAIADVEPDAAAEVLGLPPLTGIPFDAGVAEACEMRSLLQRGRRRRHASAVASLWEQLDELHGLLDRAAPETAAAAGWDGRP